jgi:hypothetical protein
MLMDAGSGLVMEERELATTAPASRPARRFRFRLGTMLVLVGASAPAIALYAIIPESLSDPNDDSPALTLLAIVLTGIAVGAWRRATPSLVIAQIGLTCAAILALLEAEGRVANYWLALVVAVTIVLPLLARSQPHATQESGPGSRWVAWTAAMLLNVALNLIALMIFCFLNNNLLTGEAFLVNPIWNPVSIGTLSAPVPIAPAYVPVPPAPPGEALTPVDP